MTLQIHLVLSQALSELLCAIFPFAVTEELHSFVLDELCVTASLGHTPRCSFGDETLLRCKHDS